MGNRILFMFSVLKCANTVRKVTEIASENFEE